MLTTISRPATGAHEHKQSSYEPSPSEIEAACREIQSGWTEEERFRRMKAELEEPGVVPTSSRKRFAQKGGVQ